VPTPPQVVKFKVHYQTFNAVGEPIGGADITPANPDKKHPEKRRFSLVTYDWVPAVDKMGRATFDDPAKLKALYTDRTVGAIYCGMNGTELDLGSGGDGGGSSLQDGGGGQDGDVGGEDVDGGGD
jgi:hypothetical protein